eukprot:2953398-Pleurochrysis_carterae.AAC.1
MIDSSTILSGYFNCVDDTTLDTQRSSDTPYSNEGSDVLQALVIKHSLRDEIREQLGIGFEFTHSQKTPNGGYCLSRIDRQYLPDLSNCQWTSMITDKLDDTDHALIYSKLSLIDEEERPRGRDLFTINSQ